MPCPCASANTGALSTTSLKTALTSPTAKLAYAATAGLALGFFLWARR